jgi:light-regulated signal transduction histidine kinase (bacteriophytochrome)
VVAASVLVAVISARITRPLQALTDASEAIAAGEYSKRVATSRRDEIGRLGQAFNAMAERVQRSHDDLEARVSARTSELQERVEEIAQTNEELESFSYSVSHDLRSPLRHITGFVSLLENSASARLGPEEQRYLQTIRDSASRMGRLIDDLLTFSRMARTTMDRRLVSLSQLAESARREVATEAGERRVTWNIDALPEVEADPTMLHLALVNLFSNAVKYTGPRPHARIDVGTSPGERETVVFVRDNGVGFDPRYADKLFGVFQRLHRADEFEGTGIGLANVRRIVHRHGGRVWAEGEPDRGATFFFSLPLPGA